MAAKEMDQLAAIEDDDEMLILSTLLNKSEGRPDYHRFDLNSITPEVCKRMFRFEMQDLDRLRVALNIPDKITCRNGTTATGLEGLCILLRRLAYPNRLIDISRTFGRSESELSYIINELSNAVYNEHSHLLRDINRVWLQPDYLHRYSMAVSNRGAPLQQCWGFIDGTVRPICRPTRHQRLLYSDHKRIHGLKFQSVVTPNGLIANLFGPMEGHRHDSGMLRESGLLPQLEEHMNGDDGTIFSLYGDPVYPLRAHLLAPFKGGVLTDEEKRFNKKMSAVRVTVEWGFAKIISNFAFLDYKKNLKLYLQPVGKYFLLGALLTNCHTCLYGSEVSQFFEMESPSLEEYLAG